MRLHALKEPIPGNEIGSWFFSFPLDGASSFENRPTLIPELPLIFSSSQRLARKV